MGVKILPTPEEEGLERKERQFQKWHGLRNKMGGCRSLGGDLGVLQHRLNLTPSLTQSHAQSLADFTQPGHCLQLVRNHRHSPRFSPVYPSPLPSHWPSPWLSTVQSTLVHCLAPGLVPSQAQSSPPPVSTPSSNIDYYRIFSLQNRGHQTESLIKKIKKIYRTHQNRRQ